MARLLEPNDPNACPCCGMDMESDDWSDAHYCGECGWNHENPGHHEDDDIDYEEEA